MGILCCTGAMMMCSFGAAPASLITIPMGAPVLTGGPPAATIMDSKPMVNIPTFGVCMTPSNPTVAAATAAAMGVLTPMPCIPATAAPWAPGSPMVLINNFPALSNSSICNCMWGGVITITVPGQVSVMVP